MSNFKYKLNQKNAKKKLLKLLIHQNDVRWLLSLLYRFSAFFSSKTGSSQILLTGRVCVYVYVFILKTIKFYRRGCPRGVMVKAMDCRIVVSEFKLQSRYYVHKYPWGKVWTPLSPSYGLNSTTTVFLEEWLWY